MRGFKHLIFTNHRGIIGSDGFFGKLFDHKRRRAMNEFRLDEKGGTERKGQKTIQDNLADAISRHLCFRELRCILWWSGGVWTLFNIWLLLIDATTKHLEQWQSYSLYDSTIYAVGLYFFLGMRWVRKNMDKENGGNGHNRFYGEFWMVLWLLVWAMLKFSMSPSGFNVLSFFGFGDVFRMPEYFPVAFGFAASALGIFRGKEVVEIIQTGLLSIFKRG